MTHAAKLSDSDLRQFTGSENWYGGSADSKQRVCYGRARNVLARPARTLSFHFISSLQGASANGYSGRTVAERIENVRSNRLLAGQNTSSDSATGFCRRCASISAKYSAW